MRGDTAAEDTSDPKPEDRVGGQTGGTSPKEGSAAGAGFEPRIFRRERFSDSRMLEVRLMPPPVPNSEEGGLILGFIETTTGTAAVQEKTESSRQLPLEI